MRLQSLLVLKIYFICNILVFAGSANASETGGSSGPLDSILDNNIHIHTKQLASKFALNQDISTPTPSTAQHSRLSSSPSSSSSSSSFSSSSSLISSKSSAKICPGVHIRNDLKAFDQLRGCNIIDGPLTISLVANLTHAYEHKDYENITFPDLIEVTEYLLFFRVQGLTTLSRLFPNLAVIRGKELFANYALIIYEMMHLQKIHLPKLTDILRGSVRIESNPNLCYVSTVNWEGMSRHTFTPHFIRDNNARCTNRCPDSCHHKDLWDRKLNPDYGRLQGDVKELGSDHNRSLFCWSNHHCQILCQDTEGFGKPMSSNGSCCSEQCAGGCSVPNSPSHCVSCRFVSQGDTCVEHCDQNYYEHKGRCITEETCISMVESIMQNQCDKEVTDSQTTTSNLKAIRLPGDKHGRCQASCPPGHEEDPANKNKCKTCVKGKCPKVCTPPKNDKQFMVTNVNSLRELSGCTVINGSLEINIKGGRNVLYELETAFQELEEIKGFLKITRSYPIVTLSFLSQLKAINGSILERDQYSLIIIDNPALQELFMFNKSDSNQKQLNILRGKIFVHLNPKLCPRRIENLKTYASVEDWDEKDVSIHTNGDKEACSTDKLNVHFSHATASFAMIRFENYALKMEDPRSLLYYLISYREASNGTVTMFDGRDGCSSQNDVWKTKEELPIDLLKASTSDQYQEVVVEVKPSTRYALYVKTFTILAGSTGALSDIIYFETAPDTPMIPRQIQSLSKSHDTVIVSWSPPSRSNGIIERYSITITEIVDLEDLQNIEICDSLANRDKITQTLTKEEPTQSSIVPTNPLNGTNNGDTSSMNGLQTCSKASDVDVDLKAEQVSFQDMIIDIVFMKQPCSSNFNSNRSTRKRRNTKYDFDEGYEASQKLKLTNLPDVTSVGTRQDTTTPSPPPKPTVIQPSIIFNGTAGKTEVNVSATGTRLDGRLTYAIAGLKHFTSYTIEVVACHGEFVGKNTSTSKKYHRCSLQAITQVRTQPIEDYDKVLPESVLFNRANETTSENIVTWKKPKHPNGLVLGFRVRYRPKSSNSEIWSEACINNTAYNHDGGFIVPNIGPGVYLLSVQTISMYSGQRFWSSPELEFEIEPNNIMNPWILTLLVGLMLLLLAFAVASGTYYYQKKRHEQNGLIYASVNPDYIQYDPDEWEVDKAKLTIGEHIGTGSFGIIYKGQLNTEKGTLNCAIKTVPPTSTAKQRVDFLREASFMKQIDTYHVVKLMGVISTTTPVYVIMEYMESGDLKTFLRKARELHQKEGKLLVDGIYLMAAQIADGMCYLASKKIVHRDLAARNCLVGENQIVKISDFGLSRDIYVSDYYRRGNQGMLPVRWMAPEALNDNVHTSASDVWSYGIVLWEIVTFSAYPYHGHSNEEVVKRVTAGHVLSRPENCPDKLFYIMDRCWRKLHTDRPSFVELVEYLLPLTEGKLYPNCFYRKQKTEGDSIVQTITEENNTGVESYPLLSWPSNRVNGLTNGVDHSQSDLDGKKVPIP